MVAGEIESHPALHRREQENAGPGRLSDRGLRSPATIDQI